MTSFTTAYTTATKKPCIKDPKFFYSGKECSPLGLGYTAAVEEVGTIMEGRDKTKWMVGIKNGVKVWNRIPASIPVTPELVKEAPILSDDRDADAHEIAEAVQKLSVEDATPKKKTTKATTTAASASVVKKATPKKNEDDAASTASSSTKTKRAPNDFNIYMKYRLHILKKDHPSMAHKDRFSMAASEWKEMSVDEKKELILRAKEFIAEMDA